MRKNIVTSSLQLVCEHERDRRELQQQDLFCFQNFVLSMTRPKKLLTPAKARYTSSCAAGISNQSSPPGSAPEVEKRRLATCTSFFSSSLKYNNRANYWALSQASKSRLRELEVEGGRGMRSPCWCQSWHQLHAYLRKSHWQRLCPFRIICAVKRMYTCSWHIITKCRTSWQAFPSLQQSKTFSIQPYE